MRKVQFGTGPNPLDGWENRQEHDGNITKPLDFEDQSVDFILVEHVVEHVTHKDAYNFFKEANRILKPGGVLRIIVPDVKKIWELADADYFSLIADAGPGWWKAAGLEWPGGEVTAKVAVETILYCHGHQSQWNAELLITLLSVAGFDCSICRYGESKHSELHGVDSHWQQIGLRRVILESIVVEAVKP